MGGPGGQSGGDYPFHPVELINIPVGSSAVGDITAQVRTPSNAMHLPHIEDNGNGSVGVFYQPTEVGPHSLDVRNNGEHVQGSPFKFYASPNDEGKVYAYGPGLSHGVCGDSSNFVISTKGAGAGGLALAVEGPSKADINCIDNKDGTVNVSYLPTAPGEYKISARFAGEHIEGSPFTCKVTGEGKKRNAISVGSASEVSLPQNISDYDLRSLNAYIVSPSGSEEPCFLKKLPKGNTGISFTPREVGEHLVSVKRSGKHITNSPFKIMVNPDDVGDASRVKISGPALKEGATHEDNMFTVDTKSAGYGGLSLSVEGPSKAEIKCKDNEDGTLDVSYKPSEPGLYIVNLKFADQHAPGSPFAVAVSGQGTERQTEKINRMREAVPVTEVGSQCRLTFKMPGIKSTDLKASVTSPTGKVENAIVVELEDGLYAVNFVPYELGVHTVSVMYRDVDIPGSPFQFTVGPLQDGGAHRVHAGGPGLERGVQGQPSDFNVWTREAGHGSLAIAVEGPSKAEVEFKDRKDGSCHVSYVVEEPGEYSVGIRFNDQHIPGSPYKVYILPSADDAERVRMSNVPDSNVTLDIPTTMLLNMNGAEGDVECKIVAPSGREDDCFITPLGEGEHTVRFVPKEEGVHYLHARLNGIHIPGSPFKLEVQGNNNNNNLSDDPSSVAVRGLGIDRGTTGKASKFVIDTSGVGAGTLSITVDGPSKVDLSCNEVDDGYEVTYTPMAPGKYYVTVKYNGKNVRGSPFSVMINGDNLTASTTINTNNNNRAINTNSSLQKEQSRSSMTMETMQRTSYIRHQYSEQRVSSMSMSRNATRNQILPPPKQVEPDPKKVKALGKGLEQALISRQNSFTVDCNLAGNNVLYVGVYGPEIPCDEVVIKHQGDKRYSVSYVVHQKGEYIIFVKWGDDHIPGSPYRVVA
jgi:filamin